MSTVDDNGAADSPVGMRVGETRRKGVVSFTCISSERYEVECGMCGWKKEYPGQAAAEWIAFCHNRNFRKGGLQKCGEGEK